jgi:hypothetical protein
VSLDRAEHLCEHQLVEPGIDLTGECEQAISRVALEQRVDVDEVASLSPTEDRGSAVIGGFWAHDGVNVQVTGSGVG